MINDDLDKLMRKKVAERQGSLPKLSLSEKSKGRWARTWKKKK